MTQPIVARYAGSVTLGTAITLSLLLLMQHLIATGESPFVSSTVYRLVPFARVRPDVPADIRPTPEKFRPPEEQSVTRSTQPTSSNTSRVSSTGNPWNPVACSTNLRSCWRTERSA